MTVIAAIDAGASEIKVSLFDTDGREIAHASRDCPTVSPEAGWAEAAPEILTVWPIDVLAEAMKKSGLAGDAVTAIGVTGSRATVLPMRVDGRPTGPVIFWYDRRAAAEADALAAVFGRDRFLATTGVPLDPTPSVMKILWLRTHRRDAFAETEIFALPQSVVLNALTGAGWFCDVSFGPYFGLMARDSRLWSKPLLAAAGLEPCLLPKLVEPGTVIGLLNAAVAGRAGLLAGIPIVASGSDAACFKIGVGATSGAIASLSIGTAGAIGVILPDPISDQRLTCCPAAIPGRWDVDALLLTGGSTYRWLRDLFATVGAEIAFGEFDRMAANVPAGSDGLVLAPHMAGAGSPLWDSALTGTLTGLRLSHGPGHLARAALEGVAYAVRHALQALTDATGPIERLQFSGGGAGSPLWAQIMADVLELPIEVPESRESAALGAAVIAGVVTGTFASAADAMRTMKLAGKRYAPGPQSFVYAEGYAAYLRLLDRSTGGQRRSDGPNHIQPSRTRSRPHE